MVYRSNNVAPASIHFQLVLILVRQEGRKGFTQPEIQDQLQVAHSTLWRWIKYLKELDLVYISGWVRRGTIWAAQYSWGYKLPDVDKPIRQTNSQYGKLYRIRQKGLQLKEKVNGSTRTT